jgi:hypothetical protein
MEKRVESRLQKWFNENMPPNEMLWKDALAEQVIFMRDDLSQLFARTYEEWQDFWDVVSTHTSKSILCPVYEGVVGKKDDFRGVVVQARYNFYDWCVSVDSPENLSCDFLGLLSEREPFLGFEGMTRRYEPRTDMNQKKFSFSVRSHYDLYGFGLVLRNHLGIKAEKTP